MQHAQDAVNSCQADISIFCTFSCYSLSRTSASLLVTSCNRRRPQSHSHAENMARSRPRAAGFFDFFLVVETVPATSTGTALACNEVTNSKTRLPKMFEVAPPAGTLEPWRMSTSKKFPDSGRLASANPRSCAPRDGDYLKSRSPILQVWFSVVLLVSGFQGQRWTATIAVGSVPPKPQILPLLQQKDRCRHLVLTSRDV